MTRKILSFLVAVMVLAICTTGQAEPDYTRRPVLMIHGYFPVDAADWVTWGRFKNKLIEDGWPEEYVMAPTFDDTTGCDPDHARKISAWVDELREKTGWDKIDIVAHSEGGLNTMYYLRYFCGVHKVRNFVGLAIAVHGTRVACLDFISCGGEEMCIPKEEDGGWQANEVLAAVNACDETLGDIRYTSIWSDYDEIIIPREGSILTGARNIELDTPMVEHGAIFLVNESLGYILDALKNKSGHNTDGPGWDCIPQCVLPDSPETVEQVEAVPETVENVTDVSEEVPADVVEPPEAVSDIISTDDVTENDGITVVPYDPGQVSADNNGRDFLPTDQDRTAGDPATVDDHTMDDRGSSGDDDISVPVPSSGCSSDNSEKNFSAFLILICLAFAAIWRKRGLYGH